MISCNAGVMAELRVSYTYITVVKEVPDLYFGLAWPIFFRGQSDTSATFLRLRAIISTPHPRVSWLFSYLDTFLVQFITPHCEYAAFRQPDGACLSQSGCYSLVLNPRPLVILFWLAVRTFATEVYTSTWVCCSGRTSTLNETKTTSN